MSTPGLDCDLSTARLGSGGFADVYEGTYNFHGLSEPAPVAVKVFKNAQGPAIRKQIADEVRIGARVQCVNCVRLFGVAELPDKGPAVVMELACGGSLRDLLDDREDAPCLPWALRIKWLQHVAEGMAALHAVRPRPIVHRDLKAANVLLSSTDMEQARENTPFVEA